MHLTEQRVQNAVIPYLNKLGYRLAQVRGRGESGVDIKARHTDYARYFEIEVKGEPGQTANHPNSGREVRFLQALGQIVTRLRPERGYRYGIAFPASYRPIVLRRMAPSAMKALSLSFFFVSAGGKVEHVTWQALKKQQAA